MGLMRTVARTAVISSTAQASMNSVNRRQARRGAAGQQQAQPVAAAPAPVAAPAPAPAAGGSMDDKLASLERLSALKAQGILTEEEFAQQKAIILAG